MPLTEKGSEILHAMEKEYGTEKGKHVFYASKNKGTISGVDSAARIDAIVEGCERLHKRLDAMVPASTTRFDADFKERDHPPDEEGKFSSRVRSGGPPPGEGDLPYGKAEEAGYADPGYRGGEKRYPLKKDGEWSEERIRAAWNYIHKERDADKYTEPQLKRIKEKIVSAWKKAIDEKGPPEARA